MEAALNYALNSFPVIVSVVELPSDSEMLLGLTADVWTVLLGGSSTFIAVMALFLSIGQAWVTRRHNKLMVRPHLDHMHSENNPEGLYVFEVKNNGVGPAILKSAQIYVDGQPVDTREDQVLAAIRALFPGISDDQFGHQTVGINSYIAVGQVIPLMSISVLEDGKAEDVRKIVEQRAYILASYESIYGEPFKYDSRAD